MEQQDEQNFHSNFHRSYPRDLKFGMKKKEKRCIINDLLYFCSSKNLRFRREVDNM